MGVILAAAVVLYALFHCLMAPARQVRALPKGVWVVAILLLPVIGAALWFWLGAPRTVRSAPGTRAPQRGMGPDDDPEFLRKLEAQRRQKLREGQLAAKEAELKAREARLNQAPDAGTAGPAAGGESKDGQDGDGRGTERGLQDNDGKGA